MQYTIRNISPELDRALKAAAKQQGESVNQVALMALAGSVNLPLKRRNLRGMPGSWTHHEAAAFDSFLAEHREIDDELWR